MGRWGTIKFIWRLISFEVLKISSRKMSFKNYFHISQGPMSRAGRRHNIKMPSHHYRDSHVEDKTVSPTVLTVITWESPYLGKTVFILRRGTGAQGF